LAHEIAADGLLANAGKQAHTYLHGVLDTLSVTLASEIVRARSEILSVEGKTIKTEIETQKMTFDDFLEAADYAVIEDAYKRAARLISPDLAKTYSEHLADQKTDFEDYEEALLEAHTDVAALGLVDSIKSELESEAETLANDWLTTYEVAIKELSDERQNVYRELREMSADPLDVTLAMPKNCLQPTVVSREDGTKAPLPSFNHHLLCDEEGNYPDLLNTWELEVLEAEMSSGSMLAWYRNPSFAKPESLGIVYYEDGQPQILRPDFIFFNQGPEGIQASIVDPHGQHLADSLPKLHGLRDYVERHGDNFDRVQAVAKTESGEFRSLDIKDADTRAAITIATSAKSLFEGPVSKPYPNHA